MNTLTDKNFFFCYSKKVHDFLNVKGVIYITKAINPQNKLLYSMYHKTPQLQQALDEYRRLNENQQA